MKKKVKKYAEGGATGAAPPLSIMPTYPRSGSNMGLTGIRDAASDLIGTAGQVSQMSQSLVGGGGMGGGFGDDYGGGRPFQTPDALISNLKQLGVGFKKGGKVSSASKRADGIAQRGKTRGKMV